MSGPILVINAGSSSVKFSGYEAAEKPELVLLFKGQIEGIGLAPHMSAKDASGANIVEKRWPADGRYQSRRFPFTHSCRKLTMYSRISSLAPAL